MWYGSQLHVCDKSSPNDRTMRVGILTALKYICMPIGNGMAGHLIRKAGFFKSFLVCLVFASMSLMSAAVLVKDAHVPVQKNVSLWGLFKFTRVVDSFKTVFKKSLGKKRIIVFLLILAHVTALFSEEGRYGVILILKIDFKFRGKSYEMNQYSFCPEFEISFSRITKLNIFPSFL